MNVRKVGLTAMVLPALGLASACDDNGTGPSDGEFDLEPGHALLEEGTGIELSVEGGPFEPGGTFTMVLENGSDEAVGHNLCIHRVEERAGEEWRDSVTEDRVCTMELYTLEPGASATYDTELPSNLAPGEYRVRAPLHLMESEERRDQVSGPFAVEE